MTMAEYIDREALAMRVLGLTIVDPMVASYADAVLFQIQQVPAADVVEVKYGRWVEMQETIPWCEDDVDTFYVCSVCKCRNYAPTQYCPDCGAKMEAE